MIITIRSSVRNEADVFADNQYVGTFVNDCRNEACEIQFVIKHKENDTKTIYRIEGAYHMRLSATVFIRKFLKEFQYYFFDKNLVDKKLLSKTFTFLLKNINPITTIYNFFYRPQDMIFEKSGDLNVLYTIQKRNLSSESSNIMVYFFHENEKMNTPINNFNFYRDFDAQTKDIAYSEEDLLKLKTLVYEFVYSNIDSDEVAYKLPQWFLDVYTDEYLKVI